MSNRRSDAPVGPFMARLLGGVTLFAVLTLVVGLGLALLIAFSVWLLMSSKASK